MSELINKHDNRATIRWKLLTGASALTLMAYVSSASFAKAEDADRPSLWLELGGQLSRLSDNSDLFAPEFPTPRPSVLAPSQKFEKPPHFGFEEDGKISFQPENSDWVLSASIRYGRALNSRHVQQQTKPAPTRFNFYPTMPSAGQYFTRQPHAARFAETRSRNSEQHTILDFQAGKDVGLGLFGKNGSSTISLGVRFAQFHDKSNVSLKSDPDWHFQHKYYLYGGYLELQFVNEPFHSYAAAFQADRSFKGLGPSLSWKSSVPFAGNQQDGELALDWDVNVAAIFGRQRTRTSHRSTGRYQSPGTYFDAKHALVTTSYRAPPPQTRSRNVTVPNVGGSMGLSWRVQNFKMNFGYRADFFFGAIDGGIDARKNENRGFHGPYASISIGLGD